MVEQFPSTKEQFALKQGRCKILMSRSFLKVTIMTGFPESNWTETNSLQMISKYV